MVVYHRQITYISIDLAFQQLAHYGLLMSAGLILPGVANLHQAVASLHVRCGRMCWLLVCSGSPVRDVHFMFWLWFMLIPLIKNCCFDPGGRALSWVSLVLGLLVVPLAAHAGCSDIAAPAVDWRRCYLDGQSFAGADLSRGRLRDATFQRSVLDGARLDLADAYRAKFISASLKGASLRDAKLQSADFTKAVLVGADLAGADLREARFIAADLTGADLTGASIGGADFRHAVLDNAIWLDGKRRCAVGSRGTCR